MSIFYWLCWAAGLIGRYIDRKYSQRHEVISFEWDMYGIIFCFPIASVGTAYVTALCGSSGVDAIGQVVFLVINAGLLLVAALFVITVSKTCTPADAPTFAQVWSMAQREKTRQAAIKGGKWAHFKGAFKPCAIAAYRNVVLGEGLKPTRIRTFAWALVAVIAMDLGLTACACFWFLFRMFLAFICVFLKPTRLVKEIGNCMRQRDRISVLAYTSFFIHDVQEIMDVEGGDARAKSEIKSEIKEGANNAVLEATGANAAMDKVQGFSDDVKEEMNARFYDSDSSLGMEGFVEAFNFIFEIISEIILAIVSVGQAARITELLLGDADLLPPGGEAPIVFDNPVINSEKK